MGLKAMETFLTFMEINEEIRGYNFHVFSIRPVNNTCHYEKNIYPLLYTIFKQTVCFFIYCSISDTFSDTAFCVNLVPWSLIFCCCSIATNNAFRMKNNFSILAKITSAQNRQKIKEIN